jgi:hypothetical protein
MGGVHFGLMIGDEENRFGFAEISIGPRVVCSIASQSK